MADTPKPPSGGDDHQSRGPAPVPERPARLGRKTELTDISSKLPSSHSEMADLQAEIINFGKLTDKFNEVIERQAKLLEHANKEFTKVLASDKGSSGTLSESAKTIKDFESKSTDFDALMIERVKATKKVIQALGKINENKMTTEELSEYNKTLQLYVTANKVWVSNLSESSTGLETLIKALDDAGKNTTTKGRIKAEAIAVGKLTSEFQKKAVLIQNQLVSGLISRDDLNGLVQILATAKAKAGTSKAGVAAATAQFRKEVDAAQKIYQSGNINGANTVLTETLTKFNTSLNHMNVVVVERLKTVDTEVTKAEQAINAKLNALELAGKQESVRYKLLRMSKAAGGPGVGAGLRKEAIEGKGLGGAINSMTGGTAGAAAGKYMTEGGGLNTGAITSSLYKHITGTLAKDWETYRSTGREFGTMGEGGMSRATPYIGHQGRMAGLGLNYGVGAEGAQQAYTGVAGNLRVGGKDQKERYENALKITEETIQIANATGVATDKVTALSKAYRDNLGKSAKEAGAAGWNVAFAMKRVNSEISDPDVKASSAQLADLLTDIASDSNMFGKNIKQANLEAEKATAVFGRMGINLAQSKGMVADIAKLMSGASTLGGGGNVSEFITHGTKFMHADKATVEKSLGGKGEADKIKGMDFVHGFNATKAALAKNGKKDLADDMEKTIGQDANRMRILKAMQEGDNRALLALTSTGKGQKDLAAIRGIKGIDEHIGAGKTQSDFIRADMKAYMGELANDKTGGVASRAKRGWSEDEEAKHVAQYRIIEDMDKLAKEKGWDDKKKQDEIEKKLKSEGVDSAKSEKGPRTIMDLDGTLKDLTGWVFKNTIALGVLTAVMAGSALMDLKKLFGGSGGAGGSRLGGAWGAASKGASRSWSGSAGGGGGGGVFSRGFNAVKRGATSGWKSFKFGGGAGAAGVAESAAGAAGKGAGIFSKSAAGAAGKGAGIFSKMKGLGGLGKVGGAFAKKIPIIGALLGGAMTYASDKAEGKSTKEAASAATGATAGGWAGAAGGAAAGAAIGSVVPVIGTAIGGIIGGLLGGFGGGWLGEKAGRKASQMTDKTPEQIAEAKVKAEAEAAAKLRPAISGPTAGTASGPTPAEAAVLAGTPLSADGTIKPGMGGIDVKPGEISSEVQAIKSMTVENLIVKNFEGGGFPPMMGRGKRRAIGIGHGLMTDTSSYYTNGGLKTPYGSLAATESLMTDTSSYYTNGGLKTPYGSLAATESLTHAVGAPGTAVPGTKNVFDADMSMSGGGEIIFKVKDAADVMSKALAKNFRQTAVNPQ